MKVKKNLDLKLKIRRCSKEAVKNNLERIPGGLSERGLVRRKFQKALSITNRVELLFVI